MNEVISVFYKTALFVAVEKENTEIVKLLLTKEDIDVNILNICHTLFYLIQNDMFQLHSK